MSFTKRMHGSKRPRPITIGMKPKGLTSKIFLDGGDPKETKEVLDLLGFLDGQTTNPTLISKNPHAKERLERGDAFTKEEILDFYKKVVQEISRLIPQGSVSIEVYADAATSSAQMLEQGREMFSWVPNAHIKFPTTKEGLGAAEVAVQEGMRVNMTLCFTQEQAAAVYAATLRLADARSEQAKESLPGFKDVFVSPFVGRLDDRGENGMDLIKNILEMYRKGNGHVAVLTASVRNLSHLLYAVFLGSDIITAPSGVLKEWAEQGLPLPGKDFLYDEGSFKPISYNDIDLNRDWTEYDIRHELTQAGIARFSEDWNKLISS